LQPLDLRLRRIRFIIQFSAASAEVSTAQDTNALSASIETMVIQLF
jgi:hypothetical protein